MTADPLVSIVTPSLNQRAFVNDCLASIRAQAYPNIEHIVVDGGSTDGTLAAVQQQQDERLRVVVLPGSSQSQALNHGLALCRGEIIGWLNTDDAYFGTDAVSTAVSALAVNPDVVAVYGNAFLGDADGRVLRHVTTSAARLRYTTETSPLVQPAVFFRRTAAQERFVLPELHLKMDHEFWLWLSQHGRFKKVRRVLAYERNYQGRKSIAGLRAGQAELADIADRYCLSPAPAAGAELVRRWARRVAGVPEVLLIRHRYSLAFAARLDPWPMRLARQLVFRQRFLNGR